MEAVVCMLTSESPSESSESETTWISAGKQFTGCGIHLLHFSQHVHSNCWATLHLVNWVVLKQWVTKGQHTWTSSDEVGFHEVLYLLMIMPVKIFKYFSYVFSLPSPYVADQLYTYSSRLLTWGLQFTSTLNLISALLLL